MKKAFWGFCAVWMLLSLGMLTACKASDGEAVLTDGDRAVLSQKLQEYGYSTLDFTADFLLDEDGTPAYLLGVTKNGYIILEKDTYQFCECGDGNPFAAHMDDRKFYNGAVFYYVELPDGRFLDLTQPSETEFEP